MNNKKQLLINVINKIENPRAIEYLYLFTLDVLKHHSVVQTTEQVEVCSVSDQQ